MKTHTYMIRTIASLIPYARNARTHSDAQVAQLAASIREFGFTSPVVIDEDGGILAGHGRVLALRRLGVEEVPCIEAAGLTQAQRRAYVLADNKLALNAGWDEDLLRVELEELAGLGFDLELTGFDAGDVDDILDQEEKLRESEKALHPMTFTHALVSIPNGMDVEGWDDVVSLVIQAGGRVDYAGN